MNFTYNSPIKANFFYLYQVKILYNYYKGFKIEILISDF